MKGPWWMADWRFSKNSWRPWKSPTQNESRGWNQMAVPMATVTKRMLELPDSCTASFKFWMRTLQGSVGMIAFTECSQMFGLIWETAWYLHIRNFEMHSYAAAQYLERPHYRRCERAFPFRQAMPKRCSTWWGRTSHKNWVFGLRAAQSVWCLPDGIG